MCGIVGAWQLDGRAINPVALQRMRDALIHRGPDDAGLWFEGSVGLGHRRLSIIDLSDAGRMPMASPDAAVQAVFNGEVYNFRALRSELEDEGHRFLSETDSEVVLRAYEEWGVECFDRFNGMFAIAIWDSREHRMVLARDPAGQKPLYYAYRPGHWLVFASTLAPLMSYAGGALEIDEAVVKDYVRFGFPPNGRAMLKDVYTVPPGAFTIIEEDREPRTERYFDLVAFTERTPKRSGDEQTHLNAFRDAMREAVRARLVADVPLGAFLSGGLDSSLIVALMAEHERTAVKTYTIGFEQPEFDESKHAAKVAAHLGVRNTVRILTGRDVLDQVPDVVRYFDEPMADYSVLPTLAVSKLAREHVTVALTGDGADEELGGYKYYLAQQAAEAYFKMVPAGLRAKVSHAAELIPRPGPRRIMARSGVEDTAMFFGLGGFYRGAATDAVNRLLDEENEAPKRVAEFLRAHPLSSSVEAGMLYDATHTLPQAWLQKVDRASMAVGLEARSPFLDRRVLELAFSLPLDMRIRGHRKKFLVRRLLREYLPADLVDRPKRGFTAPVAHWLRHELRGELETRLDHGTVSKRGFFEPRRVRMLIDEHLSGARDHAQLLWALLVLEWWIAHQVEGHSVSMDYSPRDLALR